MTRTSRISVRLRNLSLVLLAFPVVALAQQAYTNRYVSVRAGPNPQYPVVAQVGSGAPVEVFGCLDDWSWCDVGYSDLRGWVYGPYLNYVYYGSRVPLYTYAPSLGIPIVSFSIGSYWDRYYYGRPWYGRRDYWIQRTPPHVRPPGPPPRYEQPPHVRPYGQQYQQYQQSQQNQNNQPYRGGQQYDGQRGSRAQGEQNRPPSGEAPNRYNAPQSPQAQPGAPFAPQQGAMPQRQMAPNAAPAPAPQAPPARQTLQPGPQPATAPRPLPAPPSGAAEGTGGLMGK
ncbi:MAG: SH3 domain-containing protein [Betaproteobacteria bacterium]